MADNDLKVIVKAKELAVHSFKLTSNCNRYPKKYRHSLVDRIQIRSLDIHDTLLLVASGSSMIGEERFTLKNAIVLGCYMGNGTWFLEDYPEIDDALVLCWAPTLYWEG